MNFPLSMYDIGLWLAFTAIVVLVTSELLSSSSPTSRRIVIDKTRLRLVALGLGAAFIVVVVIRVFRSS